MPCPNVISGQQFIASALSHIDCQAQSLGSLGWGALAGQSSPLTMALTALIAVFVAVFGIRLILDYPMEPRDLITDFLRVGIVLTLAGSWPAWKTLGYDVLIKGPVDVANALMQGAGLTSGPDLRPALQDADQGLAALNISGTGRLGSSQGDWLQLGSARLAFLAGALVPIAVVRLGSGLLLALAPLFAGSLLFSTTRGLFEGWLRGMVALFIGSIATTMALGVELALLGPWLADVLQRRASDQQALEAPIEALVITSGFAITNLALIALAYRIALYSRFFSTIMRLPDFSIPQPTRPTAVQPSPLQGQRDLPRALVVSNSIEGSLRRQERLIGVSEPAASRRISNVGGQSAAVENEVNGRSAGALGTTWRRSARATSATQRQRDQR
jgi:type IV secretion system protein VirB6